MKTDRELHDQVQKELRWEGGVDAADIGVFARDGFVTLSGTVRSFAERRAALDAALRVGGVLYLANEIEVDIPSELSRSDFDIAHAVRAALEWDVLIPDERIQSTVTHGVVTLYGTVDTWQQVADAELAVGNLTGVNDVISEMTVHTPCVDPAAVQAEIEGVLERRADRVARKIKVTVHDGTVRLSGRVHSVADKEAVLGAARFTRGVRAIEDDLRAEHPEETRRLEAMQATSESLRLSAAQVTRSETSS